MPEIDVSEILTDPDIADLFTVIRRTESVSAQTGRAVIVEVPIENVVGVVMVADPTDNSRTEDAQRTRRAISVTTRFRLRAADEGVQPDIVLWDGIRYTISEIKPHHRFGVGFVKATAISMNAATPSPT